jgi:Arginine deiminase
MDPLTAPRQQWDDGGNALAIDRRVVISHERNTQTNNRLEAAGLEVIQVPASELGSSRGGPRCMACPVARDPAASPDAGMTTVQFTRPGVFLPHEAVTQPLRRVQPLGRLTPAG